MTGEPVSVLLLTSPLTPAVRRQALRDALGPGVVTPDWHLDPAATDLLARPAALALEALPGTAPVVVCGVGSGALLALRAAADHPARVAGLVLATGRFTSAPPMARTLHRAVADLLPISALQALRAPQRLLLQTLDLVRPQDSRSLATRVAQPATVAWGRRDPLDRFAAGRLAGALSAGTLVALDGARPGWVWQTPERLAALVREAVR